MPRKTRLSPLQLRVIETLADFEPPWTLTGGGALCGFHLAHRTTRDLDLFWHGADQLGDLKNQVIDRLKAAELEIEGLHGSGSFQRLRVSDGRDTVMIDLVADPVEVIEPPIKVTIGKQSIRIDSSHEILVNKLCALLNRSELRDLIDLRELLSSGGDLARALGDAPRKDGGFSPLTLAWVLRDLPIQVMGEVQGLEQGLIETYMAFRTEVVHQITAAATPP